MITFQQIMLLGNNLAKLGPRRLALLAIVGCAIMLVVGLAAHYLGRPAMQPIYTGLTSQDVGRMTSALADAGLSFDVNEQRNAVLVPFGQTAKARTLLAQKGLPSNSRAGYELFDQMGSMGLTSFMQEVTRVRALEGEIARTIQALDGVAAARVHLVLPDTGSFRRERRDPSASVLLRADGRWQPAAGQVIRHIVAAAVPGMKVEQVSVASTDGRLIVAGGDETSQSSTKLAEMERSMASELEQRASRTLSSAMGSGNFQISITARLDVDRQETKETVFDPKSRVERSTRTIKQSGSTEDAAATKAAVGVEANVPREEGSQNETDKRRQREDRKEELVNYELNSKTVQTVREGYRVKGLAIAVVVNRKQILSQLGSNPDNAAVDARLAELKRLVAASTGANTEQDDRVEITAVDFSTVDGVLAAAASPGVVDYALMNIGTIVNALAMLGVVVVVLLLGVRPLMKLLGPPKDESAVQDAQIEGTGPPVLPAGWEPASNPSLGLDIPMVAAEASLPTMAFDPVADRQAAIRDRLDALVESNDVKVAKILKGWMAEARQA